MYGEYPILNNDKAQIKFSYNEKNEVTSFEQTYLKDIQEGLGKIMKRKSNPSDRSIRGTLLSNKIRTRR